MSKLSIFYVLLTAVFNTQAQIVNVSDFMINSGTSVYFGTDYTNSESHTSDSMTTTGTFGTNYFYEHWSDYTHYNNNYGAGYATYNGSDQVKALHSDFVGGAWDVTHASTTGVSLSKYKLIKQQDPINLLIINQYSSCQNLVN